MDDRQRAKHNSNLAVRTTCNKESNRALWSGLTAWTAIFDQFLAKMSYADACVLIQSSDITGVTKAKNLARAALTQSILETGGALCTLALLRGDSVLEAKADIEISHITGLPDHLVDDKATELLQLARAVPAPAPASTDHGTAEVGLTTGKLDLLETTIETYNLLLGSPRSARGEKTAATANLQQALDEIERLLAKGLDKLVLQFKDTNFYQEYTLSRDIIGVAKRQKETPAPLVATP